MAYHPSVHPHKKTTTTNPYPPTPPQHPHQKKKAGISDGELKASAHTAASQRMYESITRMASFPARGIWKAAQVFQPPIEEHMAVFNIPKLKRDITSAYQNGRRNFEIHAPDLQARELHSSVKVPLEKALPGMNIQITLKDGILYDDRKLLGPLAYHPFCGDMIKGIFEKKPLRDYDEGLDVGAKSLFYALRIKLCMDYIGNVGSEAQKEAFIRALPDLPEPSWL